MRSVEPMASGHLPSPLTKGGLRGVSYERKSFLSSRPPNASRTNIICSITNEPTRLSSAGYRNTLAKTFLCLCMALPATIRTTPAKAIELADDKQPSASKIRNVRVLLTKDATKLELMSPGGVVLRTTGKNSSGEQYSYADSMTLQFDHTGFIALPNGDRVDSLAASPSKENAMIQLRRRKNSTWNNAVTYPGQLHIIADTKGLTVVNQVDIERYVASVVAHEAWPTFHEEALKAQAMVARTFVLYQMLQRQQAAWDIGASAGDQVYGGLRDDRAGRRATRAVEATKGLVCTYLDGQSYRIFPTYYSSVCGGQSQSAEIFGQANEIPPLQGGVICNYCSIATGDTYRWGPTQLSSDKLRARLVRRYPKLASLGNITDVVVSEKTLQGRPRTIRLLGSSGAKKELLAENFRLAIGSDLMKSTDCEISFQRGTLHIRHGRGFGHGLGLCQWGSHGQALQGKHASDIIRYYYPSCRIMRAY